jgi:hypothetical protein
MHPSAGTGKQGNSVSCATLASLHIEVPPQQITVEAPKEPEVQVSTGPISLEPPSPNLVEDVLKLEHDYESKREANVHELLKKRTAIEKAFNENLKEIEDQLTELGYTREPDFVPVPASRVQPFRKAKAKSKSATEKFCPICTTDPENPVTGHDGRAHKSQKRKRPFTPAELKARG